MTPTAGSHSLTGPVPETRLTDVRTPDGEKRLFRANPAHMKRLIEEGIADEVRTRGVLRFLRIRGGRVHAALFASTIAECNFTVRQDGPTYSHKQRDAAYPTKQELK